jgi:adenine-specific DNA-methyltransferase
VVDFRLRQDLRREAEPGAVPLIYPSHFSSHRVVWPKPGNRKPNSIVESQRSEPWLMPNGWYVLTRRFSSKEERRRIVAAIFDPTHIPAAKLGFENHLNVFHQGGHGLDPALAAGLAVFLNSTLVDLYFRQFSGHTQVNVADLKSLHYPGRETLVRLGQSVMVGFPSQREIDALVNTEIQAMSPKYHTSDPVQMQQRVQEALSILTELGLPKAQRNERSALTLLALLDVKPADAWANARSPSLGITPIMNFIRDHYGKTYAPNTRETIRRATIHQFVQAGIAVSNPDQPDRPTNSPRWVYQVTPAVLELVKEFGQHAWPASLARYLKEHKTLAAQYAHDREMNLVPLVIRGEVAILSPGAHSQLIKAIIEEFGPRFAPGAEVLYVGDTGSKLVHFDRAACETLNLKFDPHGKFPDVVLYYAEMNWLFLIEAVTSHGPVDAKRHAELDALFADATAGLVYVTAFLDRHTMGRFTAEISWETEVWIAEAPSHMVHFDGESILGPY